LEPLTATSQCFATIRSLKFSGDQEHPRFNSPAVDETIWCRVFHDPVLNNLIDAALANNLELKQTGQMILEARAFRQVAAGNLFPQQ